MTERYVTTFGAGAHTGTTLADAFNLREAIMWVNNTAALTDHTFVYLCGSMVPDSSVVSTAHVVQSVTYQYRFPAIGRAATQAARCIWQGRTADGSEDADIIIDCTSMPDNSVILPGVPSHRPSILTFVSPSTWHAVRNIHIVAYRTQEAPGGVQLAHGFEFNTSGRYYMYHLSSGEHEEEGFDLDCTNYIMEECYAYQNDADGFNGTSSDGTDRGIINCVADDNGQTGFINPGGLVHRCISYDHQIVSPSVGEGHGFDGFQMGDHITTDGNRQENVKVENASGPVWSMINTLSTGSLEQEGIRVQDSTQNHLVRLAAWDNFAGRLGNSAGGPSTAIFPSDYEDPEVLSDPYVDRSAHNFALNNNATGGARCRETVGIPFLGTETVSCHDIGAVQTFCEEPEVSEPIPDQPFGGWALEYIAGRVIHGGKNRV